MTRKIGRRSFLGGTLGSLGGAIAARFSWLFPESQHIILGAGTMMPVATALQSAITGELYAGFVLLQDGSPMPTNVEPAKLGIPIMCALGAAKEEITATSNSYSSVEELAEKLSFPVYTLTRSHSELRFIMASTISHVTGEIFCAGVTFQLTDVQADHIENDVGITAQPDFPRPFPLWYSDPVEPGGRSVILEKVDFLPEPGIMVVTATGYVFQWVAQDILYTLTAEYNPSFEEAQALATSLTIVK